MTTTPRHLELFIRGNRTAAQCRTETNGRLDDPVSIAVAGPEWSAFVAEFGQTQAAEVERLTSERDQLQDRVSALEAQLSSGVDETGVPTVISPLQGRLALKNANLLDAVETAILQANGDAQIWWEYATLWHRTHPLLNALATSLGLTSQQVDELFIVAGAIQ